MPLFTLCVDFQHPDLHKNLVLNCFKTIDKGEPEEKNKAVVVEVNVQTCETYI